MIATAVPGLSAPGKDPGLGAFPVTVIVKALATAVPPLSLITCLMTIRVAPWSSFVTVQVFVWARAIVPAQSAE